MEKSGTWLNLVLKNVSLVTFVAFLGVIYIANVHVAERKQLRIEEMKKDVQKMKWQYMGIEKNLLLHSSPSQIEKKMGDVGLKYSSQKPRRLSLDEKVEK
mgnify:CR=1 FL=1|jgi:hypothetical protein